MGAKKPARPAVTPKARSAIVALLRAGYGVRNIADWTGFCRQSVADIREAEHIPPLKRGRPALRIRRAQPDADDAVDASFLYVCRGCGCQFSSVRENEGFVYSPFTVLGGDVLCESCAARRRALGRHRAAAVHLSDPIGAIPSFDPPLPE